MFGVFFLGESSANKSWVDLFTLISFVSLEILVCIGERNYQRSPFEIARTRPWSGKGKPKLVEKVVDGILTCSNFFKWKKFCECEGDEEQVVAMSIHGNLLILRANKIFIPNSQSFHHSLESNFILLTILVHILKKNFSTLDSWKGETF